MDDKTAAAAATAANISSSASLEESAVNPHNGDRGHHKIQPSLWEDGYAEGVFRWLFSWRRDDGGDAESEDETAAAAAAGTSSRNEQEDTKKTTPPHNSIDPVNDDPASSNTPITTKSTTTTPWETTESSSFKKATHPHNLDPEEMGRILERSRHLPDAKSSYIASNMVLVNQERAKRVIAPLTRNHQLDALARQHAQAMAAAGHRFHSNFRETYSDDLLDGFQLVGENVAKGCTIKEIHQSMMRNPSDRNNILDRRYRMMGMGTAVRGDRNENISDIETTTSKTHYLCQIFCG